MAKEKTNTALLFSEGDEAAFRELFDWYMPSLRFFASRYLPESPDTIEDILQDAFVILWEKRRKFFNEVSIKAYLYKTVYSLCISHIRHRKVEMRYAESFVHDDDITTFLDYIMEAEIFQTVLAAFNELTPACRQVYEMSLEGMHHKEIARILGISVNTIKKHKNNANHQMREKVGKLI